MTIETIFTAPVKRIAAGGAGVSYVEGKTVFIPMTAPGDLVRGRITGEHKNWAEGELLEIREPSPDRIPPVCPHYGSCGGCSLQHLSYEAQIDEKTAIIREAFRRIGKFSALPEIRVVRSPPFEYRNRIQLHCIPQLHCSPGSPGGEKPLLGFMGRRSGGIVPVKDCPVADPGIRSVLGANTPEAVPAAVQGPFPEGGRFTLYARGDTLLREGGESRGVVSIRGREMRIDAGLFFQSNGTMLEALVGELIDAARGADRSLPAADIYCGVGTFGVFLADYFDRIDLVEENRAALDLARENIPGKGRRFFALPGDRWAGEAEKRGPYGFAVVDPPRQGLSRILRQWLCRSGPPLLAYVSCDPATLARDSGELRAGGYGLSSLSFYDFYPQTAHVEGLALFKREAV
ncbi:MAG: class I SAM-dependent RNA methyltransferase [Spirochaetaceae bacterium]|jgi:23S rRNA (uracil1939-C5)-methyltransferase|nr:class I SAM-dependent RNA methyltransferase [Spirochaetaceae bacterium]